MKITEYKSLMYAQLAKLQLEVAHLDMKISQYNHQYDIPSLLHINKLLDKKADLEDQITALANKFNRTFNRQFRANRDRLTAKGIE